MKVRYFTVQVEFIVRAENATQAAGITKYEISKMALDPPWYREGVEGYNIIGSEQISEGEA